MKNYDETGKDFGGVCGECGNNNWVWLLVGVLGVAGLVWFKGKKKKR